MKSYIKYFIYYLLVCCLVSVDTSAASKSKVDCIVLRLNFQGDSVLVKATFTHYRLKSDTDSFYFLLNGEYVMNKIDVKGYISHTKATRESDPLPYIMIRLDKTASEAATIDFNFEYTIDLKKMNHIQSNWIELSLDKLWYPTYNGFGHQFVSKVHIENFYPEYTIFSYPHATIQYLGNGSIDITNNRPWFDVLILAGKNMREWKPAKSNFHIEFYANKLLPDSILESMHEKVENIMQFYNDKFAKNKPIKQLRLVLRNTDRKELGYQFYRPGMVTTGAEFNNYGSLSHEIAHNWWIDADFVKEPWLNEGFANYSMLLVLDRFDTTRRNEIIAEYTKKSKDKGSISDATLFSENGYERYYYKATIALWNLDQLIGRAKMIQFLSERIMQKANTQDALLKLLAKIADQSVANSFYKELQHQ